MARALKTLFGALVTPAVAKTASYTLTPRDAGKVFTNRGAAGPITFTLPKVTSAAGASLAGYEVDFFTVAGQIITIASDPSDTLVVDSDAAADSIAIGAAAAAGIGQHVKVICDGTGWLVISNPSAATAGTAVRAVTIVT